jgi:glyoxalase family protein
MKIEGLHHITAITAEIDTNLDFYGRLLGLRLIWQGVNADDPDMRHIAVGDDLGNPGTLVTFFDMPGVTRGRAGAGMVHRVVMRVASEQALDFWERRIARAGVATDRTADRLAFSDPEGLGLELVVDDGEDQPLTAHAPEVDPQVAIRGLHAVRAYSSDPARSAPVLGEVLGMELQGAARWLAWGEHRHSLIVYDTAPPERGAAGAGTVTTSRSPFTRVTRRSGAHTLPLPGFGRPRSGPQDVQVRLLPRGKRRPTRDRHRSAREHWDTVDYVRLYQSFGLLPDDIGDV